MFKFCVILVEFEIPLCIWETQISKVRPTEKKSSGFSRLCHELCPPRISVDPSFICECICYHHGSLLSAKVQTGAIWGLDCASYFSPRTGCST